MASAGVYESFEVKGGDVDMMILFLSLTFTLIQVCINLDRGQSHPVKNTL
jgi:hypothetical protein